MTDQQVAWDRVVQIAAAHADRQEGDYIPELADALMDYWAAVAAPRIAFEAREWTADDYAALEF